MEDYDSKETQVLFVGIFAWSNLVDRLFARSVWNDFFKELEFELAR